MSTDATISTPATEQTPLSHSISAPQALWATGRRKTSVARVHMIPVKSGAKVEVNKQTVVEYFRGNDRQAKVALQSLELAKSVPASFIITVKGGGISGQAVAIRHGIARALAKIDSKLKVQMRKEGYLTRDPRAVERKKPGQPKARKRFQYSKR